MMMPLITPIKCPKCSGAKWSDGIDISEVASKGLEKITPEEMKEILSKGKVTERVQKIMVDTSEEIMKLQAQAEYVCESCGYVLGDEK